MAALSLLLLPNLVFAQDIQTEHWHITVQEDQLMRLDFAIEYIGEDLETASTDIEVDTSDVSQEASEESDQQEGNDIDTLPAYGVGDVLINEFVSDPVSGEEEWVELYNPTDAEINLNGWQLIEGSGRVTELTGFIGADQFALINDISGSLNNHGDELTLLDSWGTIIDSITYGTWYEETYDVPASPDPSSTSRFGSNWLTTDPTPGSVNLEPVETADVSVAGDDNDTETTNNNDNDTNTDPPADAETENNETADTEQDLEEEESEPVVPFIPLADIRSVALDTEVITEGVVSVAPGILGKQYFYLAGSGIQTYLHSAEFPRLTRGMRVRVQGVLSEVSGERRLKLASASDIQILGNPGNPSPHDVTTTLIGEATEGWLVRVTGMLVDKNGASYVLADDEGEVRVVIKPTTGIALAAEVGDELTVTGVVSETSSGFRILPRDQQDVLLRTIEEPVDQEEESDAIIAGITGHNGPSRLIGWILSAFVVLTIAGFAAAHAIRKKKFVTA